MTQVEVTVPAYALVNNPIPVSINLPGGGARIRMQVIYGEEVIYESVYNILKSIKIDISDILQTIVSVKDRDMTEISFCDDSEQQCEYEIKLTELFDGETELFSGKYIAVWGGVSKFFSRNTPIDNYIEYKLSGNAALTTRTNGKIIVWQRNRDCPFENIRIS